MISRKEISQRALLRRTLKFLALYAVLIGISLLIGIIGYRLTENYSWIDCFLNAGMLMGGMGQINTLKTDIGKAFAGSYAIYCGSFEIIGLAILLSPIAQWVLRFMHVKRPEKEEEKAEEHREEKKIEKGEKPGVL